MGKEVMLQRIAEAISCVNLHYVLFDEKVQSLSRGHLIFIGSFSLAIRSDDVPSLIQYE